MGGGASVNKTSKMQIIFARLEFHAPLIIGEIKKGLKMQWNGRKNIDQEKLIVGVNKFSCLIYISQIKWQKIFDQVVKVVWHVCSIYLARQRSTQSFPAGRTILPNPSRFRYHPNVGPISFRFWIFRIFQNHWNIPICWSHAMLKLFNPWNVCLFHKAKVFLSSPTNRRVKPRLQEAV